MASTGLDRPGAGVGNATVASSMSATRHAHGRGTGTETPTTTSIYAGSAIPHTPVSTNNNYDDKAATAPHYADERFSQSDPRSAEGSQASNATSHSDHVFTPTASDTDAHRRDVPPTTQPAVLSEASQLHQLSALAAAQDRMSTGQGDGPSRKRMADGEVKSPNKGHSRNTSAVSAISTASTIGDLSHDLKTRLSYAMIKVNNGWQHRSLNEVETLASQGVSPTSSTSTPGHRRNGSSASPQMGARPMVHFADGQVPRRKSNSPPRFGHQQGLAPPASIRPSVGMAPTGSHPRRNSNTRYTPTLLSQSRSAGGPRTPAQLSALQTNHLRPGAQGQLPQPNNREQDAIETLLFMSSPNNSANLKHSFSPAGSPGPSSQPIPKSTARQPLPTGPRKALPGQKTGQGAKRVEFDASPGQAVTPGSPMELDSPYRDSPRGVPRRRTDAGGHVRSAMSLPSALGITHVPLRKPMSDKDIDRMLDRGDDGNNSSDDDEIQIPRRNGVGAIHA